MSAKYTLGQTLYRAEHNTFANKRATAFGDMPVHVYEYTVVKVTPKGAWVARKTRAIEDLLDCSIADLASLPNWATSGQRWIGETTKYAWPTEDEAIKSVRIRAARALEHCRRRLQDAEQRAKDLGVYTQPPIDLWRFA